MRVLALLAVLLAAGCERDGARGGYVGGGAGMGVSGR